MFTSQKRGAGVKLRRRRGSTHAKSGFNVQQILVLFVGMTLLAALALVLFFVPSSSKKGILRRHHKKILPESDNIHNSLAGDIISSLGCEELQPLQQNIDDNLDDDQQEQDDYNNKRRRLDPTDDFAFEEQEQGMDDDFGNDEFPLGGGDSNNNNAYTSLHAKHFMCMVAGSKNLPSYINPEAFFCKDALGEKRQALLDIWSSARTQMSLPLIQKTLELAQESSATILSHPLHVWMPSQDSSLEFLQNVLNDEQGSIPTLNKFLSTNKSLFVDVGSGLGLTTLAVALEYPNTNILSIEPASPSWLLQKLNLVCNLDIPRSKTVDPILAGVGGDKTLHDGMAKVLWRPSLTRLTRTWTSKNETTQDDLELVVRLRSLRSILAEYIAEYLYNTSIESKVLNLDCEGCEYNLVPALTEGELQEFDNIIGMTGVHWGYIPVDKLPSSQRAETTHKRLCHYYDYARQCMECCAFPTLEVLPNTVVGSNIAANMEQDEEEQHTFTISKVAGDLCNGFQQFQEEKLLYASNDDYGWTELTSMAE